MKLTEYLTSIHSTYSSTVAVSKYIPLYPGAQVQLKCSAVDIQVPPFRHTPASHAASAVLQFGDNPGAPTRNNINIYDFSGY